MLAAFVAVNVALALGFLRMPRRTFAALVVLSALSTLWFNPLAQGGSGYLQDNALAQKILEIDRGEGGDTTWVAFGRDDLPEPVSRDWGPRVERSAADPAARTLAAHRSGRAASRTSTTAMRTSRSSRRPRRRRVSSSTRRTT